MKAISLFFWPVKLPLTGRKQTSSSFCSWLDNTEQTQACQPSKYDAGHYIYLILFHKSNLNKPLSLDVWALNLAKKNTIPISECTQVLLNL